MTISEDAVKVMERGQITIPIIMRKKLGLKASSLVRIILTREDSLIIKPMQASGQSLSELLKKMRNDKTIYWTAEDEKRRIATRKKSNERLKRLYGNSR